MNKLEIILTVAQNFLIIIAAYVLCHGITTFLVAPVQKLFLSHITIFASLMYLPHGVRLLATWLMGWRAVIPLFAGALISNIVFTSAQDRAITDAVIYQSLSVGALSAYASFAFLKLLGLDLYANESRTLDWKWLLAAGALASVFNSVGQSIVYFGMIYPEEALATLAIYAFGDLIGLIVSMIVLMMIFRWIRLYSESR